jgi:selenide,water dikinase
VTLRIDTGALPLLPGAEDTLRRGILTKAHTTNTRYVRERVSGRDDVEDVRWLAAVDPQTSGGLLLSVDRESAPALLETVVERFPAACVVGEVTARSVTALEVT